MHPAYHIHINFAISPITQYKYTARFSLIIQSENHKPSSLCALERYIDKICSPSEVGLTPPQRCERIKASEGRNTMTQNTEKRSSTMGMTFMAVAFVSVLSMTGVACRISDINNHGGSAAIMWIWFGLSTVVLFVDVGIAMFAWPCEKKEVITSKVVLGGHPST